MACCSTSSWLRVEREDAPAIDLDHEDHHGDRGFGAQVSIIVGCVELVDRDALSRSARAVAVRTIRSFRRRRIFGGWLDHCSPVPPHSLHFCSPQSTVGFRLAISDLHHSAVSRRAGRDNHDEGKIASILVRPGRTMRPGQGLPARQRAFQIRVAAVGLARGLQDSRGSAPDRDLCPRVSPASPSRSSSTAAPRRDSSGRSETTGQAPQDGRHGRVASFGEGVHFCSDTALGAQIHCPW